MNDKLHYFQIRGRGEQVRLRELVDQHVHARFRELADGVGVQVGEHQVDVPDLRVDLVVTGRVEALDRVRQDLAQGGTELARAQMNTLRCKLLKVGAVVVRNTRRIRFFIARWR